MAVGHAKRFREQIDKAAPTTENALLAKEALVDVADSSGVDLIAFSIFLEDLEKHASQVSGTGRVRASPLYDHH